MTHYTVKESDNPKRPGWVVITGEVANPPFKPIQYIVNDMVLPTKKEADAYCDRLNKLFGDNHDA